MKGSRTIAALCLCSIVSVAVLSQRISAAEESLTKELVITASSEQDYKEQAESAFDLEIEKDGQKYERAEIRYKVTDTKYLDKKEKVIETADPAETITEGGVEYTLVEFKAPAEIEQRVSAYDDYDHPVTAADVPATKDTVVTDEATGAQKTVTCSLTGVSPAGTATVDNVMTITFSNYDAAYYEWNGNYIARNDQTPPIAGYEDQLLAQAGATAGSVITGCSYSGDPYTVDGVVYRDATATVQQQVQMYRANYEGTVLVQDPNATGQAYYSAPDPDGAVELTVTATAVYEEVDVPIYNYIVTAVIVIGMLALIFFLLYLIVKKRKKEKKAEV
jgi:hypothetical protein